MRPDPTQPAEGTVPVLPILTVNFVGMLGFSIVLPFLVFLVTRWGGNALVYGLLGATYSTFQLIGAPLLGRWSDRVGRRRVLLLSQAGTLASWIIFLVAFALPAAPRFAFDVPMLGPFVLTLPLAVAFVARAADGLTGGNISVATAYLADISTDATRNANYGRLAVSSNLGFVLGPALAGLLGATVLGEVLPVAAAALISVVATLLIAFRLPESHPCVMRTDPRQSCPQRMMGGAHKPCYRITSVAQPSFGEILRMPGIAWLLVIYFLVMLGFNFFYIGFPMHAATGLGWSVSDAGIFFAVLSLMMVLVQGPLLERLSRRAADTTLVMAGSLVLAASFLCFVAPGAAPAYAGAALLALGNGVMWPSVLSVLARTAGERHQGAVQGVAGSCGAVASILGMLAGGMLFDRLGVQLFVVPAAMIFVVFLMALRWTGRPRAPVTPQPVAQA